MTAIAILRSKARARCRAIGKCNAKISTMTDAELGDNFQSPEMRDDDREDRRVFLGPSLCWYIELFEFCGSFRDFVHESCIVKGGVLKSTLVVHSMLSVPWS